MRKMTAAMAALGVVAGLGAAALPLSSYASEATVPVTAIIDDTISINVTDAASGDALGADGVLIEHVVPGQAPKTKNVAITVSGDAEATYTLTIEDRMVDTALIGTKNSANRISTGTDLTAGAENSAWGYNKVSSVSATPTSWLAVPPRGSAASLLTSGSTGTIPAAGKATTYVAFGVYAKTGQAADRYTSDVIFTAAAN